MISIIHNFLHMSARTDQRTTFLMIWYIIMFTSQNAYGSTGRINHEVQFYHFPSFRIEDKYIVCTKNVISRFKSLKINICMAWQKK